MIVASMKLKEMHDELEKDVQKLQIWINKTKSKAVKFFEKQNSFPTWCVEDVRDRRVSLMMEEGRWLKVVKTK